MDKTSPTDTTHTHTPHTHTPHTHTTTTHTHTPPTHTYTHTAHTHTGVEAKAKETPKRGANNTSLAPGCSAANAASSSAGTGLAEARTTAKTKTKSRNKRRTPALLGTSTAPSSLSGAEPPVSVHSGGRAPLIHPPPPIATQAAPPPLAVTGQPEAISTAGDAFALAWQVQRSRHKGRKEENTSGTQRHRADSSARAAPAPPPVKTKRKNRPSKKQRLLAQWKGKAPQNTQANAAGRVKPISGNVNFSAGRRAQAEAGNSRPGPSQPATSGAKGPAQNSTQRSVRRDQAAAKRALNETSSPRGERKRPRLDKSKRDANRSYAQTAGSDLDVAVTCNRTGFISREASNEVLAAIQRKIVAEATSPTHDSPAPTFRAKPVFSGGVLKLWCGSNHTLAWLRTLVSELAPTTSTSLVVRRQAEIQRRVRCGILIPDEQGIFAEPSNIGRALCYQNPWVDIKGWVLLGANKQADAWYVVVGVPEDQIPTLMKAERRLSFGVGTVYVRFQGPNGIFVDVPQGYPAAATSAETLVVEATPPATNAVATSAVVPAAAAPAAPTVAGVDTVLPGEELADDTLSSASEHEGDGFDAGDLFAGLRLEGDEEGATSDGVPFVTL